MYLQARVELEEIEIAVRFVQVLNGTSADISYHFCQTHSGL